MLDTFCSPKGVWNREVPLYMFTCMCFLIDTSTCTFVVCCLTTQTISHGTSSQGDQKVARVGRPAADYKIIIKPWENGIQLCISCHFPQSDNNYVHNQ